MDGWLAGGKLLHSPLGIFPRRVRKGVVVVGENRVCFSIPIVAHLAPVLVCMRHVVVGSGLLSFFESPVWGGSAHVTNFVAFKTVSDV